MAYKKKILFVIDSLSGGGAERILSYIIMGFNPQQYDIYLCLSLGTTIDYKIPSSIKIFKFRENLIRPPRLLDWFINVLALFFCINHIFNIEKMRKEAINKAYFIKDFYSAIINLNSLIDQHKFDLIFSFLINSDLINAITKFLFKKSYSIVCAPHIIIKKEISNLPYPYLYRLFTNIFYKTADCVVAVSKESKLELLKQLKVNPDRIKLIHNGVDINTIRSLAQKPLGDQFSSLFNQSKVFKIITIGRLDPPKNQELLLKAFQLFSSKNKSKLFILGQGEKKDLLLNLCRFLEIEKDVVFMDWQPNPYKYLKKCDLFVLPSSWETFPCSLLEAMALQIPIVATKNEGTKELLNEGKSGFLVPNDDHCLMAAAIDRISNNDSLKKKFIRFNQMEINRYDLGTMIQKYELLIETLIK